MKRFALKFLIILLIFVLTAITSIFCFSTTQGAIVEDIGLNKGFGLILTFIIVFILSYFGLKLFKPRVGLTGVLTPMGIVLLALIILNLMGATIKFTYKVSPYYITWVLALISGYWFYIKAHRRLTTPVILFVFPLVMAFGLYDMWFHRVEYGNWTGEIEATPVSAFEFFNKENQSITNESLKGKVVLFDFWFISCPPCWVKFPELQRIYDQYQSDDRLALYAVNRPMRRDKEGELYTSIEEKGYTFPVLLGSQEILDSLNIYKYPTVMILNEEGSMVFMGELEDAEEQLKIMLVNE